MSARDLPPEALRALLAHVPAEQLAAIRASAARGLEALKTPEPIGLPDWANRHFYLSAESSQAQKRWESYPYQVGMLHVMGDDHIEEVTIRKSARVGYTKMLLAAIAYFAQHKRRNQCIWQPTDADSDEFCKAEVEPMLRDVRVMQSVLPSFMRKSKANTLNMKKFLGSILFMKGGTSSGNYRRMTLQVALLDEFSAFDQKIDKSADPWTLAHKRLEGANYPKLIAGSTPRVKGLDHTERREAAATARLRYHIDCPHCGTEHPLLWGMEGDKTLAHGIKWDVEDPEATARHLCPHCHGAITQADYLRLWHAGRWVSHCGNWRLLADGTWTDATGSKLTLPPRHVAFHVWTAYSPQTTWAVIVREYLDAVRAKQAGDSAALEGFTNETLGETWEEEVEKTDSHELQQRAEPYPLRRVPPGGLDLVAAVDCQEGWWYVSKWAIGRGEESWLVDRQRIDGNLASMEDWETRLYPYVTSPVHHWYGQPMRPRAIAVDTGGHYTHQVYSFCRAHMAEKFLAIKGDSQAEKPIKGRSTAKDVTIRGRVIKGGVKLWMVGTDTAKDLLFGRLKITQPGPGYIHFSRELDVDYFKGFTSEVRRTQRTKKGIAHHWVQVVDRNEPLDTAVYCLFASHFLGHHTYTDAMWERLEQALLPDLFSQTVEQPQPTPMAATVAAIPATPTAEPDAANPATPPAPPLLPPPAPIEGIATNPIQTSGGSQKAIEKKPRAKFVPPAPPANPFAPADWMGRGFA
jgi:phage terminase large subunit GpA-like protein